MLNLGHISKGTTTTTPETVKTLSLTFKYIVTSEEEKDGPSDNEPDRWYIHSKLSTIFPISYASPLAHELTQEHLGYCSSQ